MSKKKPPALSLGAGGGSPQATDSPDGGGGALIAVDTTSAEIERCRKMMQGMKLTAEEDANMNAFLDEKQKITEQGEMKEQHFVRMAELGFGNGGVVLKVEHKPTGIIIARKMIMLDIKPAVRNQIMRELKVLHECASPQIVGFYGNFCLNNEISICMQHMDGGSLDLVMRAGRIPVDMITKITVSVVKGLIYLREKHNIIHRDVKPSNILVNTRGEIKLCDFGVSGQLIDSMANSFVGTRSYMAPERLQGSEYSVLSDIWSLGISLAEMALGRYPIPQPTPQEIEASMKISPAGTLPPQPGGNPYASHAHAMRMPIFELLQIITTSEPPTLPSEHFSEDFRGLVEKCLQKDPKKRDNLKTLEALPCLEECKVTSSEFADWVKSTVEANSILEREEASSK